MFVIDSPFEQTTAVTDLLLAITAIINVILIYKRGNKTDREKTIIWVTAFLFLAFSAILGAYAHGIKMPESLNKLIWQPLNLLLGLTVAFFTIGVLYDLSGFKKRKLVFILLIITSFLFYLITLIIPGLFLIFIIYEALAMLFAFGAYFYLFLVKKFPGAQFMFSGILVSIIASVIQTAESVQFHFIWFFDHNGLFHILQIMGLILLCKGIIREFSSRSVKLTSIN